MLYDKAYPSNDKKEWREEYKNVQLTQLFINGMNKEMILYLKGKDIKDFNVAIPSSKGRAGERPWEGEREGRGQCRNHQVSSRFMKTGR